jgi:hypothetical protein
VASASLSPGAPVPLSAPSDASGKVVASGVASLASGDSAATLEELDVPVVPPPPELAVDWLVLVDWPVPVDCEF